ncbi:hypothetical protein N7532_006448 [Penicillium argentinense]|uniref:Enoyl reductase (ER) domain-containing protein n=1 Tax=Penicillium argentinense TaxID=1131581 RepID=A0A9W9FFX1_9EURO|nr:uncharacterized protein N7532_006448 [Penicillium argentinense]KAJ5099447.1 hypothetical protein N7532_006448 [Penicillium argentinense]
MILQGKYPFPIKANIIPGCDGAGTVLAIGKNVTRFQPGDKVVTFINQWHLAGSMNARVMKSGLGGSLDGTFRQIGAFDEQGLVTMPNDLSFTKAATSSCAGLTAWNALFGDPGRRTQPGHWVLTQGTGGMSIFVLQFAKAVGARVIATTSSTEKEEFLRKLGADHVINYRDEPNWGEVALKLTGGEGVDCVVDVAGPTTLTQSVAAVRLDGLINIIGIVGGGSMDAPMPSLLECWSKLFTARGLWMGNREQVEEMCRAIQAAPEKLRPVVEQRVFKLEDLKDAYRYSESGHHQGKVCVDMDLR